MVEALSILAAVRDVQDLGRGFYVPVPLHRVPWNDFTLLVSSLPNQELERLYRCNIETPGASRIVEGEAESFRGLPEISFLEWLAVPSSTKVWTQKKLAEARYQEPIGLEGAEVFRAWPAPRRERWLPITDPAVPDTGLILVRHRAPDGRANHYLVRRISGRLRGMSELPQDVSELRRLQFGLRTLGGDSARWSAQQVRPDRALSILLDIPPLPAGEHRLLQALACFEEAPVPGRWRARIPLYALSAVESALTGLGLTLQEG